MKTILSLTAIAVLSTPAFAGTRRASGSRTASAPPAAVTKGRPAAAPAATAPAATQAHAAPAEEAPATATPARAAVAGAAAPSDIIRVKDAPVAFNFGEDFGLRSSRVSARPQVDEETFTAEAVSSKEAIKIVKSKTDELEYCWSKVPAAKRVETSATLHVAIEASGAVAGAWIDGTVPASVEKCMTARAARWVFPAADVGCEIEHGFALSTLESKGL